MSDLEKDGWTEATDIQVDRVDLVAGAANGTSFLLTKSAEGGAGLLDAEAVRELVKEAGEPLAKAEGDADEEGVADLDVTEALASDAPSASGNADQPGSPAWEAVDAATARKWSSILARAKNAVELLCERERLEAATGDTDDYDNAYDLGDACGAIDYAISLLAPYALGEQMEVEFNDQPSPLEGVTKAVAALDADPSNLQIVEALAPLRKAGRVLSSANEAAIRTAVDSLQGVLASLPAAPDAEPVLKAAEPAVEVEVVAQAPTAVVEVDAVALLVKGAARLSAFELIRATIAGGKVVELAKAATDPVLAVFDENGKLIGTVDPADLSPIASSAAQAADAGAEVADGTDAQPAEGEAADPAAPPAADAAPAAEAPAAPAAATIPGTATVQSPPKADEDPATAVAKSAVAEAFGEVFGPFAEQLGEYAGLAKAVGDLQERVERIASRPDTRNNPLLHGATGVAGPAPRDGSAADGFAELQKAVDEAKSPGERRDALSQLAYARTRARFARD